MDRVLQVIGPMWKAILAFLGAAIIPVLPVIQDELTTWAAALISGAVTGFAVWLKSNTAPVG